MAWPQTALPVFVEIAPGAAAAGDPSGAVFTDVTTSVFQVADQIEIGIGRGDWGEDADAGSCSATFRNQDGHFSEFNPMGQWYGQLGKDTPLRAGLRRSEDAFGRASSAGWGTSDSGDLWESFAFGGTFLASDLFMGGGVSSQSVPAAAAYRAAWLLNVSLLDVRVRLSGIALSFTDVTGGSVEPGNILLRMQDINTYYMARIEITAAEAVILRLYNPAGTQLAAATVDGLTHSAAQTLEAVAEITGDIVRMKVWATSGDEPSDWQVTATDTSLMEPGGIGVRTGVAAGNTNAKPIIATYDSVTVFVDLFGGWVPAWVPRSDKSGKIRTVPVSAKGALYRSKPATGNAPELSPFRRLITSTPGLLGYWPCEDLAGSTQVASAIPGGTPMAVTGTVDFAGDPSAAGGSGFERNFTALGFTNLITPGTKALPNLAAGGKLTGTVTRLAASSPVQWSVCFLARTNSLQAGEEILLMEWTTPGGTYKTWRIYQQAGGTIELFGIDAADVGWSLGNWPDLSVVLTEYRIEAETVGGGATIRIYVDGDLKDDNTFGATTLTPVVTVIANPLANSVTGVTGWWIGHIQVWDTSTPPPLGLVELLGPPLAQTDTYGEPVYPFYRWLNETSHDRLERLGGQATMPMFVPPVDAGDVTRMGPQPDGTGIDLMRECERTDGGVLYERPFGLGYVPRTALYNAVPALELSTADLAEAPAPDGSRQRYRNRWDVTRTLGSSAVAEAPEIEQGAIVNPHTREINTADESTLADHAGWGLHLTSSLELRWPALELDLWTAPHLLDAWLNCRPGSRITAADPPADVAGQDIDVILEGWAVTLGHKSLRIVANCSPARLWDIAEADGEPLVAADGSTLAIAADASDTQLLVSYSPDDGPWSEAAADVPFEAVVSGEPLAVTAVAPSLVEAFGTPVAVGWGTGWTCEGGVPADFFVSGGRATQRLTAAASSRRSFIGPSLFDSDQLVTVTIPLVAVGDSIDTGLVSRYIDGSNYYLAVFHCHSWGAGEMRIRKQVGGVYTTLYISPGQIVYGAATSFFVRFQTFRLSGGRALLRARVWPTNRKQPIVWQAQWTETEPALDVAAPGGVRSNLQAAWAGPLPVDIAYDNYTVLGPQQFTVSRGLAGFTKDLPAGAPVDVRQPAIVSL